MHETRSKKLEETPTDFFGSEAGIGVIEVLIVFLIMSIITVISVIGITKVRSEMLLSNAGESMRAYLEKAGADAKRRHAQGSLRSTVEVLSPSSYRVQIDFDGDGKVESRVINLSKEVSFLYEPGELPKATFDWRGRIAEGNVTFSLISYQNQILDLQVNSVGDASEDENLPTLPTVSVTPDSSDIETNSILSGTAAPNIEVEPTPTPSPLSICTANQKPAENNCCCKAGKIIKSDGKCS